MIYKLGVHICITVTLYDNHRGIQLVFSSNSDRAVVPRLWFLPEGMVSFNSPAINPSAPVDCHCISITSNKRQEFIASRGGLVSVRHTKLSIADGADNAQGFGW